MVNHTSNCTLYPPCSVANIFGNWLHCVDSRFRILIRVGALVIIWSLWLYRNNKRYNDKNSSFMQVIYQCKDMLQSWSSLQCLENRDLFIEVYTRFKDTVWDFFFQHGWQRDLWIGPPSP
jgi:hypothetical protein